MNKKLYNAIKNKYANKTISSIKESTHNNANQLSIVESIPDSVKNTPIKLYSDSDLEKYKLPMW